MNGLMRMIYASSIGVLMFSLAFTSVADSETGGKRFHPGFYVEASWNGVKGLMSKSKWMWQDPNVRGVYLPITWSRFEPREGKYDFSQIDAILPELQKRGKYLIVQIYHHGRNKIPKYLYEQGGVVKSPKWRGDIPKIWEPEVMDKLINALKALGDRYDDNPAFEGSVISEFPNGGGSLYKCMDYTNEWIRMIREVSKHYKHAVYFAQVTFACSDKSYAAFEKALVKYGAGISTTDLLRKRPTGADRIARKLKGQVPYLVQGDTTFLQRDLLKDPGRHDHERYDWGVEVGATHFGIQTNWWARKDKAKYQGKEYQKDIMSLLPKRHPEFGKSVNGKCPTALSPCQG